MYGIIPSRTLLLKDVFHSKYNLLSNLIPQCTIIVETDFQRINYFLKRKLKSQRAKWLQQRLPKHFTKQ